MRAKTLSHFKRGVGPKASLGIGMGKDVINQRVKALMGSYDDWEEVEEWIADLANEKNGAFDIYLEYELKEELYHLVKLIGKDRIKIGGFDLDEDEVPARLLKSARGDESIEGEIKQDYLYKKYIQKWLDKGWEIWYVEENFNVVEYILINYNYN